MLTKPGARTKVVTAVVLALVFGSGVLLGYAADRTAVTASVAAAPAEAQAEAGSAGAEDGERRRRPPIYEKMNPTRAQSAVMDSIMLVHRERMNRLHAEFRVARDVYETSFDALVLETREAIAAVFPPEKAEEYRRLLAERDRREAEDADRDDRK